MHLKKDKTDFFVDSWVNPVCIYFVFYNEVMDNIKRGRQCKYLQNAISLILQKKIDYDFLYFLFYFRYLRSKC